VGGGSATLLTLQPPKLGKDKKNEKGVEKKGKVALKNVRKSESETPFCLF